MLELVSLEVKCPHCQTSLMDRQNKVDNKAGIKLDITTSEQRGTIWLSSIYGSFNYKSSIDLPNKEIVEFSCPHCNKKVISDKKCTICQAPLIPFHLLEGGKVEICSRSGCTKHSIEIEDIETAIKHFYKDFPYKGKSNLPEDIVHHPITKPKKVSNDREIIATGTYLNSFCPHCKKSLIENNMLKFVVTKDDVEEGFLLLSPYFNVFSHKSTIRLPEKLTVKDIKCWHCNKSLMVKETKCLECGSETAKVLVAAMSKMIDFHICSKKGCTWHGLSDEDLQYIIFEDTEEW